MLIISRCTECFVVIETELAGFKELVDDAREWSIKYNSGRDVRLMCPECSKTQFQRIAP
jgi:hypothetical protein